MLQLFYCTLNETLPLAGESNGGRLRGITTPVQAGEHLTRGGVRVRACVRVCRGEAPPSA